jgi:tRNA threonylcarbamoyladenosine biosynthesis protein TsaB
MTRLLAIDTSTLVAAVALVEGPPAAGATPRLLGELAVRARPNHAETLMRQITSLLELAGLELGALDAIAVGAGPGSFTGLRIGFATAKGLCYAAGRPLVAVSSLDALALGAQAMAAGPSPPPLVAALDARKGELFFADYELAGASSIPRRLGEPRALDPPAFAAHLAARAAHGTVAGIGDGFAVYGPRLREALGDRLAVVPHPSTPPAWAVAWLGLERFARGEHDALDRAAPTYVRPSDAEIGRRPAPPPVDE